MKPVKTAPCPRCQSFRTLAHFHRDTVVIRTCESCTWCWDFADGTKDQYAGDVVELAPAPQEADA